MGKIQLTFEEIAVIGSGKYPDFIQFERTEGELFFLNNGLMYGTPSKRLKGDFSSPEWMDTVEIGPQTDTDLAYLELNSLSGFGIVGSYKTDYEQKLIIYEYYLDMNRYLDSGSIKHSINTPITSFSFTLENPMNENTEHEGNVAISEDSSLISPGSKVELQFSMGDSELYPLGIFYVDRSDFTLLSETVDAEGRNLIGKALHDQSFDDDIFYPYNSLHEVLKEILYKANINLDDILIENTSILAGYQFDFKMSYLDGIMEILKAFDNWQIKEETDGTIVIGSSSYSGFTRNSRYTFYRDRDIFSRSIVRDDQEAYRRVCVHNQDFTIKVYREVETYSGWNLQANKTLYVPLPEGTSLIDAERYASQIASSLQYVGKIESFTGPIRPQIMIGDEAEIISDTGKTNLGLITEITHRFGKSGFYTEFTVDSGGRLGKGRLSDYISKITKDKVSSNRIYE